MNSFFQTLALTYLLYPMLGLLLVGLGIFIAKKNALLGNKRLVGYTVGAAPWTGQLLYGQDSRYCAPYPH